MLFVMSSTDGGHARNDSSQNVSTSPPEPVRGQCASPQDLVSEATRVVAENVLFLATIPLEILGVAGNTVNCLVFKRQGLRNRINLCTFVLSASDVCFLLSNFFNRFAPVLGLFDQKYAEFWTKNRYNTSYGVYYVFLNFSSLMVTIISVERFLCVVAPLKTKACFSTKRMFIVIVALFVYIFGVLTLFFLKYSTIQVQDPITNSTRWVNVLTSFYAENKVVVDILYNHQLVLGVPTLSLVTVTITTSITVVKLRDNQMWRRNSSLSRRSKTSDGSVTKTLIAISILYVTCMTLSVLISYLRTFIPEFLPVGKFCNTFLVGLAASNVMEVLNSSVNTVIYFTIGTKFRETFWEMCRCCCGRKSNNRVFDDKEHCIAIVSTAESTKPRTSPVLK